VTAPMRYDNLGRVILEDKARTEEVRRNEVRRRGEDRSPPAESGYFGAGCYRNIKFSWESLIGYHFRRSGYARAGPPEERVVATQDHDRAGGGHQMPVRFDAVTPSLRGLLNAHPRDDRPRRRPKEAGRPRPLTPLVDDLAAG